MSSSTAAAIEFVVPGVPQQQGSKNRWGGEDNPRVKPWRGTVAEKASEQVESLLYGPVEVEAEFVFPRPKSHYRTGVHVHELKPTAPHWHTGFPDLDKLQRAIGDALAGVVISDDRQIASWLVTKRYGPSGYVEIAVRELTS
jgi:Holliday junction resolvase RusA-like endonuclease